MKLKQGLIVSAIAVCALLVGVLPATAQTTMRCTSDTEIYDATTRANITVPRGETCLIENSTITGNVTAARDADLILSSSTLNGNVTINENAYLDLLDSAINGSLRLRNAYGAAMIGSAAASNVTSNDNGFSDVPTFLYLETADVRSNLTVRGGELFMDLDSRITGDLTTTNTLYTDVFDSVLYGDVSVSGAEEGSILCTSEIDGHTSFVGNSGDDAILQIGADGEYGQCGFNVMAGDVEILDNTADIQLANNAIRGNLICEGNDPAPVLGANRLRGEGIGQCDPAQEMSEAAPMAQARVNSFSKAAPVEDRHAELEARIAERRAAAGVDEPTAEEKAQAEEAQTQARAAEAEAAPAAPARPEGRALPPRARG